MISEMDANRVVQRTSIAYGDLDVGFDPSRGSISVVSTLPQPGGGGNDTEVLYANNGGQYDSIGYAFNDPSGQAGGVNQAYIDVGTWAYAGHANIDEDDGIYRHAAAFANGVPTPELPTSGYGAYDGRLQGSLEHSQATVSGQSTRLVPLTGTVSAGADFNFNHLVVNYDLVDGISNQTIGGMTSYMDMNTAQIGTSSFKGDNVGSITLDGTSIALTDGETLFGIAGPEGEEAVGTFSLSGSRSTSTQNDMITGTGAFLLFQ